VYNWATLSLGGHKYKDLILQVGVGHKAGDLALQKKKTVAKSEEVKPDGNPAEPRKEGYA
jgi:hypothetical protein